MEYLVAEYEDREDLILDKGIKNARQIKISRVRTKEINMKIMERINKAQSDVRNLDGILSN
jgi:hypothetical protein